MKSLTYSELRPLLITGAIVLWKSPGIIPWLIRQWSEYSHASLIVRLDDYVELKDRVWLVEALAQGISLGILSKELEGYKGEAFVLIPELNIHQQSIIRQFALNECGERVDYDFFGLFANVFGRISFDVRKYICSEFCYQAMVECGQCPVMNQAPRPGDLPIWVGGTLYKIKPE
jgi:hypothetical protein